MKALLILGLMSLSVTTLANSCFTATYCATGSAPRFILCGRGQDCTRAKDMGIRFVNDCTVSWWLGDAAEFRNYEVNGKTINIEKRPGSMKELAYELSDDNKSITMKSEGWVYTQEACQK